MFYVARQPLLTIDDIADNTLRGLYQQRWIAIGVGTLAVILALVMPFVVDTLYLTAVVLFLVLSLFGIHRAGELRKDRYLHHLLFPATKYDCVK